MAKLVLIISPSGTGKSSSLRGFKKGEAAVVLCSGKELPFKNDLATMVPSSYADIYKVIDSSTTKIVVIDDLNYMMSFEEMSLAKQTGFAKFTQMAQNMLEIFRRIIEKDSDQVFYIFAHSEDTEDGTLRFKTTGKMLSEKIVLEGLVNIVLTNRMDENGEFIFVVKTDGKGVKTPLGMFDTETIPNDLTVVDKAVRNFYGISNNKPEKKEGK